MCSSPKTSHKKLNSVILRPTQLSGRQQADFAAKANQAWERRELRRQQHKASADLLETEPASPTEQSSPLRSLWQMLFRSDTTPPASRSHSTQ